ELLRYKLSWSTACTNELRCFTSSILQHPCMTYKFVNFPALGQGPPQAHIHQPHEAACRIKWVTGHEPLTPALDDVVLVTPPNGVTGRTDAEYGAGTCHP
ncbi:hypothetical protein ACFTXM_47525, partial [Streptomyces sp. NPDC056930]|uniref:hypothetical protein n=1 Tax=Streptomyces sp. NPDC056930 TaxID=3345967 RepID=UPI0036326E84